MSASAPDPDLTAIEAGLRSLVPIAPPIDRDRLFYDAGRRSVRRGPWPLATGAFGLLSVFLGWRLASHPDQSAPNMVVQSAAPPPTTAAARSAERSELVDQNVSPYLNLLLVGAPNYLPAQPVHAREIELWLEGGPPDPDPKAGTMPELLDRRLGLPPGTLGNPPRTTGRFGPIRGDV